MQSPSILKLVICRKGSAPIFKANSVQQILNQRARSLSSQTDGVTTSAGSSGAEAFSPSVSVSTEKGSDSLSLESTKKDDSSEGRRASISKAMTAYLKRAKENQEFFDKQEKEFVFGRRHLANMMGKDPESFTQKDIDEAIRYLFPSGLYEPRARPLMRPPAEVYPKQKEAQFDISGRPHHPFFYTSKPNFYYLLHEMVGKLNSLNKLGTSTATADTDSSDDSELAGSVWLSKEELEERLLEKINDQMYNEFISCFDRIAGHPKRNKELEFIKSYRRPLAQQTKAEDFPPITLEPDGRKSVHVPLCMKKTARADVLVTVPGTGEIKINGKGLDYFASIQSRSAVIAPLQLVDWLGKCDVEAHAMGGNIGTKGVNRPEERSGETSRAVAVRYGIAVALAALGADVEKLRLAGYLTRDRRTRERKKNAHEGARKAWTWKKR